MPDFVTLRLTWEPRMLSILRIIVGLLYMEHGLAKILDFPHQPNHAPYALFTLAPYPSASGGTKCCSREGRFVVEQITNIIALGARDDRLSALLDRVPATLRR